MTITTIRRLSKLIFSTMDLAKNSLGTIYPAPFHLERFPVPEEKVSWAADYGNYFPPNYTAEKVLQSPPWADPEWPGSLKFNEMDGLINRKSYHGMYAIGLDKRPLNPMGRTGIAGRGVLGKWGPNHAADCIVTRPKLDPEGHPLVSELGLPVWEFVAIQRRDTGQYALPGGMVDPGETVFEAAQREFLEEVMDSTSMSKEDLKSLQQALGTMFLCAEEIYKGYVADHRNTDNSWMETFAVHCKAQDEHKIYLDKLKGGSDATKAQWLEISGNLPLYASHSIILENVAQKYGLQW